VAVNIAQIATLRRQRLYQGQPGTSVATLYTVPASTDVKVTEVVLCNVTGADATVTLSAVPSGNTAGVTNRLVDTLPVAAHETAVISLSTYLTTGDFLAALQGTSGAVTVTVSGELYS
jgi:hypothetical protein